MTKPSIKKPECRVIMVFAVLGVGGAETWLIALLRHFKKVEDKLPVRLKIDICLTGGMEGPFDDEATSLGARLFHLPYTRKKLPSFVRGFRKILSCGCYHAIHDHQDYTAGLHFLFGAGLLPPVRIVHVHNPAATITFFSTTFLRRQTLMAGKRLIGGFATHIMGTSRQILTEYGFDELPFRRITKGAEHCGFDTDRYRGDRHNFHRQVCQEFRWPESVKILFFAGRLSSNYNQKNPAFALDVAKACISKNASIRLLMAGGGDKLINELKAKVEDWGLSGEIRLIGERNDVSRLMLGSDLFLFPSIAEGLGMVAVEAQAAGLPVLASDSVPRECVVLPDLVKFLPLNMGAAGWAEQALQMLAAPHPDMGACNLAVRNSAFSIENSAKKLLEVYWAT
ncbi:MAG: glycosyltransferase [Verrucomicrobia bacterium]|nr:glycosyltransferase [Verrucomicrobiota bacterium]